MNDFKKKRACVFLTTRAEGSEENLRGTGTYRCGKTRFRLNFEAGETSFEISFGNTLQIVRKGDISYDLRFCAGESTECALYTPYGKIPVMLRTLSLHTEFSLSRAEVSAEYTLSAGGEDSVRFMRLSVLPISENYVTGEKEV